MNQILKSLILKRQHAFHTDGADSTQFKHLRNRVNRERKVCRAKYYESRVQQLKGENSKKWRDEVKRLSGSKANSGDLTNLINFSDLSQLEQANAINSAFLVPLEAYKLSAPLKRLPLESNSPEF